MEAFTPQLTKVISPHWYDGPGPDIDRDLRESEGSNDGLRTCHHLSIEPVDVRALYIDTYNV